MTPRYRFLAATALSISTMTFGGAAALGQQFGPSPQAMYKQHPGSAPSYVSYGEPTVTPQVAAMRGSSTTSAKPVASTVKPATAAHKRLASGSTNSSH